MQYAEAFIHQNENTIILICVLKNSLHSSNLKDEGLKLLANSLSSHKHFRSLDIGDCQLTDKCVSSVREMIHRRDHQSGTYFYFYCKNTHQQTSSLFIAE